MIRNIAVAGWMLLLAYIAVVDMKERKIRDRSLVFLFLLELFLILLSGEAVFAPARAAGLLFVSAPMLVTTVCLRGGFGGGDIKLMAAAGVYLGAGKTMTAFVFSLFQAAACIMAGRVFKRGGQEQEIPFGPFLCAGIMEAYFFGEWFIRWFLAS